MSDPVVEEVISILEEEAKEAAVEAAEEAVDELIGDGLEKDEALDIVFNVLDSILAFKEVGIAWAPAAEPMGLPVALRLVRSSRKPATTSSTS